MGKFSRKLDKNQFQNFKDYRHFLLFILWPFLSFIVALFNYRHRESKTIIYLFIIYYGLTFVIGDTSMDSERYAMNLKSTAELPFSDFFEIIGGLYTDTTVDIFAPFVTFVVSRFTSHHGLLFAILAGIMGVFYLKSINLLLNRFNGEHSWNAYIFLFFFVMVVPITTISGVRMPIAFWIFFFGAYHIVLRRDARYFLVALASCFVHWSFITANIILLIYYLFGNRNFIYLPLAILSFVLPQLLAPVFQSLAFAVGGPIQSRYEGYSNEDYIYGLMESYEGASWFIVLSDYLVSYYFLFAIFIIKLTGGDQMKERPEKNLFSFLLLFISFVNFGKAIPSFGGRFQTLFYLFASLYVFLYFVQIQSRKISLLTFFGLFPMLLLILITFRVGSETINAWIFAPGLGLPLFVSELSIADFMFR